MYYTYILRCEDNSLYTGIAKNLAERLREHKEKDPKGAKYTKARKILGVEAVFESENRSSASKLECAIKKLKKEKKEKLILTPEIFPDLFPALPLEEYRYRKPEEILGL